MAVRRQWVMEGFVATVWTGFFPWPEMGAATRF